MRFIRAFDAILPLLALGRKQLRNLIHAARPSLASGARRVIDGLANLEPVIAQIVPLCCPAGPWSAATEPDSPGFPTLNVTTESWGTIPELLWLAFGIPYLQRYLRLHSYAA